MARPNKYNLHYFPTWSPIGDLRKIIQQGRKDYLLKGGSKKNLYKLLLNSSAAFICRKDVRDFIFKRDNYKCKKCGNTDSLQIDHVVSVYACAQGKIDFKDLNTENNLQTLCSSCNSSKKP